MTSDTVIIASNNLMQTLYELEAKAQYLVNVMDQEHPKKLLRQAKNAFKAAKVVSMLSSKAGVFITTFEQRMEKIYGKLYQVRQVAEQRKGSVWQKFINYIKGAMDIIADLTNIAPLALAGTVLMVPELMHLSHLVPF